MFELFADSTPNARKISIMLEEIEFDYKVTKINIYNGEIIFSSFITLLLITYILKKMMIFRINFL